MVDETPTLSSIVAQIFAEYQPEPFQLRRQPHFLLNKANKKKETHPAKRRKMEELPVQLLTPEMIRHVAGFLDPFELMAWSGTCKATFSACSLAFKLDCVFKQFHILKRYADRVHAKGHSWSDVMEVLLAALKKLHDVYGPYHVHPLHAAIIGEAIMSHMSRYNNLTVAKNHPHVTFLRWIWQLRNLDARVGPNICETLICGELGDVFVRHEGLRHFQTAFKANPNIVPPGPGRVLAQEGRMPYINVVRSDFGAGRNNVGFSFQNNEGNISPYIVFCMNIYGLPDEEDTEATLLEWYNGPKPGCEATVHQGTTPAYKGRIKSIEQAFCQFCVYPAYNRFSVDGATWDQWTQLLRVAWLYAHNIAPFDGRTEKGKELWASVLKAMPEADPDEDYELTGQEEVLYFRDEEEAAEEFARNYTPKYIGLNHDMAKGSDYCL